MAATVRVDFLNKLPGELLNKIYQFSLYDAVGGAEHVEIFQSTQIRDVRVCRYTTNADDVRASLTRLNSPSSPRSRLPILFLNRKARTDTIPLLWAILSTRLLFSNTILLAKMAPTFSTYIREVTILKRYQNGAYCDIGTFNMGGQEGNSGDLVRSIEALKDCPQLREINIQLSIFNCQWQFAIAPTLLFARQILGFQARIHITVNHCVSCSPTENAFGIPDYPFRGVNHADVSNYLGTQHRLQEKEYWEWTIEAGGTECKIERFVLNNNIREKRESLDEILDNYRRDERQNGRAEADVRLQALGRTLQQRPCFVPGCPRTCATINPDLRLSRPNWCRGCGNHLTCGVTGCLENCQQFDHVIRPAKLTFTFPAPTQIIHPAEIRRLGRNGP